MNRKMNWIINGDTKIDKYCSRDPKEDLYKEEDKQLKIELERQEKARIFTKAFTGSLTSHYIVL